MTKEQIIAAAQRKDAVLQASIDFIAALTGMKPPPIEIAPSETFQPFRDFTEQVCQIFDNTSHTADGLTTKTEAPASQAMDADLWYLQDTRSYVGNDVMWWAKEGKGYTTDVSKAHVYDRASAFRQADARGVDRPWPKSYIDSKTRPAVDVQYINHDEAITERAAK